VEQVDVLSEHLSAGAKTEGGTSAKEERIAGKEKSKARAWDRAVAAPDDAGDVSNAAAATSERRIATREDARRRRAGAASGARARRVANPSLGRRRATPRMSRVRAATRRGARASRRREPR
jgi:hypothetical protein